MIKLFLFLSLLIQVDTTIVKPVDSALEKRPYKSKYATEQMPETLTFKDPVSNIGEKEYANPYHPADLSNPSLETVPTQSQYADPVDSILHSRVDKQASIETQTSTKYFDVNATNFEKFAHSPCYTTLGFDPNANLKVQENRYQECESGKRNDNLKNVLIAILVLLGFATLIYFGVAKKSE